MTIIAVLGAGWAWGWFWFRRAEKYWGAVWLAMAIVLTMMGLETQARHLLEVYFPVR